MFLAVRCYLDLPVSSRLRTLIYIILWYLHLPRAVHLIQDSLPRAVHLIQDSLYLCTIDIELSSHKRIILFHRVIGCAFQQRYHNSTVLQYTK